VAVKLVISDTVAFPVHLTLNDGGKERDFGFRMEAKREAFAAIQAEMSSLPAATPLIGWLRERVGLRMVAWTGESPLVDDETGAAITAGDQALEALTGAVSNVAGLIWGGYVSAISAKGKSGN
jgi:hypothetical protein